jgi:hypothetical protein
MHMKGLRERERERERCGHQISHVPQNRKD